MANVAARIKLLICMFLDAVTVRVQGAPSTAALPVGAPSEAGRLRHLLGLIGTGSNLLMVQLLNIVWLDLAYVLELL